MNTNETAEQAEPFFGEKLYHQRARAALPLLVRQAKAQQTIYYGDLAAELDIPNPRNLNYVLGSVGQTLIHLAGKQLTEIPPIQCLVINQADELPGEGVGFFIDKSRFKDMSKRQKRLVVEAQLQKIFSFTEWDSVLANLGLKAVEYNYAPLLKAAHDAGRGSGGESEHHLKFKEYIASNPQILGLPRSLRYATEYGLPSGDTIDILFRHGDNWIGVEVKSHISDEADITRGIFQCIKYRAVLEAQLAALALPQNVRIVLVLERPFPSKLIPLRNLLGIEVIEQKQQK
ncbi:MAG: hypothetical protein RL368_1767 [Pseudomonadota bacterium]